MTMNRSLYPSNWNKIALQIKEDANWQCQECHRVCRKSGETLSDFIVRYFGGNLRDGDWSEILDHPQRYTLTVAHLNHEPSDCSEDNLKALCAPCHCRYDLKAMGLKRRIKRERQGQRRLFDLVPPVLGESDHE